MIRAEFDKGQVQRALDAEFVALSRRVRLAMEQAGRDLVLMPLREMTAAALNSRKLPTAWRGEVFPNRGDPTLSPAFFAYTKSPKIIAAFEEGPTIRPLGGKKFLWIPTENVPRTTGGRRLSPVELAARIRGKLTLVPSKKGGLVAIGSAKKVSRRAHRRGGKRYNDVRGLTKREAKAGETTEEVVFYILKPQVRLAKRLDVAAIAEKAGASYRISYERAANSQ